MKKTGKPTKSEVARVLDFLMESQSDNTTAIFIDKHTIDIDYGIFPENISIECKNGTDFCDLLENEKGFKFGDLKKIP